MVVLQLQPMHRAYYPLPLLSHRTGRSMLCIVLLWACSIDRCQVQNHIIARQSAKKGKCPSTHSTPTLSCISSFQLLRAWRWLDVEQIVIGCEFSLICSFPSQFRALSTFFACMALKFRSPCLSSAVMLSHAIVTRASLKDPQVTD